MTASYDVAVLGAGPAGLMAAYQAARAGHSVVVLEQAASVGGMAGSFDVGGVRVDHGSHRLHPSTDPAVLDDLRRLLGGDLLKRERHGRIRLAGRWIAFPLRAADMARHLPRGFALRAARDALTSPIRRPRADTFAETVRARLGPTVADAFYAPYVEKLWGTSADDLSGELARRRVSAGSAADVLRRLVRVRRPEGRRFLYPRRGFGQIPEALADAATAAGADLRLATGVEHVELDPSGAGAVVTVAGDATVEAARIWSTVPIALLARMCTPPPDAGAVAATERLRHRALALVYLVLDQPQFTEFDAHYFPERELPVARLSEPKNYRGGASDPAGRTVLCAEVPCWAGDATWEASAEALGSMVAESLARAGLPRPRPVEVEVRRLPRVYPVYRPGFEADLAGLEEWVRGAPQLLTFGRQGLFVPDNTHHALLMGREAAASLSADGSFDERRWLAARDAFRGHVVED